MAKKDKKKTAAHKERMAQKATGAIVSAKSLRLPRSNKKRKLKAVRSVRETMMRRTKTWISIASWNNTNVKF